MNEHKLPSEEKIDECVRDYLAVQEETVDPQQVLDRVRAQLAAERSVEGEPKPALRKNRLPSIPRWLWGITSAAALVVALLVFFQYGLAPASAETLIHAAKVRSLEPVDRCYQVRIELDPEIQERDPLLPAVREGKLWTRGDRFYMAPLGMPREIYWGRDEKGRVWIANARRVAVRFEPDELPSELARACDLRGMQVEALLGELLADFDLTREGPVATELGPVQIVRAILKSGRNNKSLHAARLEIENQSGVLQRVVLYRTRSLVTFTLAETAAPDDSRYRLEKYIDDGATILTKDQTPPRRLEMIRRNFQFTIP
jgi:hypothetical protein